MNFMRIGLRSLLVAAALAFIPGLGVTVSGGFLPALAFAALLEASFWGIGSALATMMAGLGVDRTDPNSKFWATAFMPFAVTVLVLFLSALCPVFAVSGLIGAFMFSIAVTLLSMIVYTR